MKNAIILIIIASIFYSCGKNKEKDIKDSNVNSTQILQVPQGTTVYMAIKYNLEIFVSAKGTSKNIDSIMKYYELNEKEMDKLNRGKIFPYNSYDDSLFYSFIDKLQNSRDNLLGNRFAVLIKLDLLTLSNAEWSEVLTGIIEQYWLKPEINFIKAVISLPDSECARIIYSTIPEEPKEVKEIIKKVDKLPEIRNLKGYDLLKKILIELANR